MNIIYTARHYGKKPAPLIYYLRSLQGQFCGTQFLISFLKLFREMNSFIFTRTIFGALIEGAFRTMTHCVRGGYLIFLISSKILLLCSLCKKISYNFTRLAIFCLKFLYGKTLDVSMMSRNCPFFF